MERYGYRKNVEPLMHTVFSPPFQWVDSICLNFLVL
uniref:Uncharacterized protein n=1 Tax=Anguilla anguilla TaxID=7936 RepID=A0A0E9PRB8_ANGAN